MKIALEIVLGIFTVYIALRLWSSAILRSLQDFQVWQRKFRGKE